MKMKLSKILFLISFAIYFLEIGFWFVSDFGGAYHVNFELQDRFVFLLFLPPFLIGLSVYLLKGSLGLSFLFVVAAFLVNFAAALSGAPDIDRQEHLRVEINGKHFVARGTYYDELFPPLTRKQPARSTQIYFRNNSFLWKRVLTVACDIDAITQTRDGLFVAKMKPGCDRAVMQFTAD